MGTTATTRPLQRRRIIERRRLLALLDETKARVRMLVAPAGYGKTTLADQWVGRDGRLGAWYSVRRASTDVAALALGLARASTVLVPDCDVRLREHLRAVPTAAQNVGVLAEILGEDLSDWPGNGWLVIDEYQEIVGAREAEQFVAALVAASPVQLLIATRQRPSWVTTRGLLYGEAFEINQSALAMDATEAAEVLGDGGAESAPGLVALAGGWPAVIGLASVASAEVTADSGQVPEPLYRFFAEEVFGALAGDVREGVGILSLAPIIDRDLAVVLLGSNADTICRAALDVGILVERGRVLELHPLARSFLEERKAEGYWPDEPTVMRALDYYFERKDWDAAFDVIARHRLRAELEPLLLAALDELLETVRLSTIETWCAAAAELGVESSVFALARSEVALRQGKHAVAQALAEAGADTERADVRFRALGVAGRAAHLASREREALELFVRAEAAASNEIEQRDALLGRVMCLIELERPEATGMLEALTADLGLTSPKDVVRAAAYALSAQLKLGALDPSRAEVASELLSTIDDPLVRSSFQTVYAAVLGLSARYDDALDVATDLLDTVRKYRLDFALPYAHYDLALAHAGRREWGKVHSNLDQALAAAQAGRNAYAEHVCFAARMRSLAQQGMHDAALALTVPQLRSALPGARAEVLTSRALVLASADRLDEAEALVARTRGSSTAIEPTVLMAAVDAIVSFKRRSAEDIDRVTEFLDVAFTTSAFDLLVTVYRSTPDLLATLLRHPYRERVINVIRTVRDEDVAQAVGHPVGSADDPRARLTPREREVFELLRQGCSNRQIARLVFIEESTVKVHTHHIYDKLGTRSRTALAVQAALERADQATSATGTDDSVDEES
jgi:DNA-binding CsgD family transcriptional regulator